MTESLKPSEENIEKVRVKCLFIEDHPSMINSLRRYFRDFENFVAVECHSVSDAMNAIKDNLPKVILLDNNLTPGGNEGLEIAKLIKKTEPDIKIYSTTNDGALETVYEKMGIEHIDKGDLDAIQAILSQE